MQRALVVAIILAAAAAGVIVARHLPGAASTPPGLERAVRFDAPRPLPELALLDQDGRAFDAARLRGHWTLLFFGFVNCPDVCPMTLATLAAARRSLADLPTADVPAVAFVSVDPRRDTPEALGRYVAHFDPSFSGVTGPAEAIDALTRALGVAVIVGPEAPDGSYSVDHTAAIFLIDRKARIAALFGASHEATTIARDYRRILAAG